MIQRKATSKRESKKEKVVDKTLTSTKLESISTKNSDNFRLQLKEIQKPVVNLHREHDIIILDGYAGTGKDYMQIYRAMSGLIQGEFTEVIFMRTIVEATSSKLGFLPGSEDDKLSPYLEIFYDQMRGMLKPAVFDKLKNKVRFEYPGFIRGKTFGGNHKGNICIILSEAQNAELRELVTISTRLAEGSKLYINGCQSQSDIGNKSGFKDFINIVKNIEGIHVETLGDEFQMRGRLVTEIDNAHRNFINKK